LRTSGMRMSSIIRRFLASSTNGSGHDKLFVKRYL
jgi:hypothetical protein